MDTATESIDVSSIDHVYEEMMRKPSNIRIQEFLSTQKQKFASEKGQASTAGQNLRHC